MNTPSTTTTSPTPATTTSQQHDEHTTQQPQNDQTTNPTRTTRTKIREQYTPRHHDLLVILTDPAGSVGCVLCAVALHAEDVVLDWGLGPAHRDCHDHARTDGVGEHATGRPC